MLAIGEHNEQPGQCGCQRIFQKPICAASSDSWKVLITVSFSSDPHSQAEKPPEYQYPFIPIQFISFALIAQSSPDPHGNSQDFPDLPPLPDSP